MADADPKLNADTKNNNITQADLSGENGDHNAEAPKGDDIAKRTKLFRILAIVLLIAGIATLLWYFLTQAGRVSTDDAYVGADTAEVTPLVSGAVKEVRVGGTQVVHKGDVLVVIDDADAKVDVATARAALLQAQQKFGQADANVGSARGKVRAMGADIVQARAKLADADAQLERTRIEFSRREALASSGAVSAEELTSARAAYIAARAQRELAAAAITTAVATHASAVEDAAASAALVQGTNVNTTPDVAAARARLDQAELNLARTVIRAPIDGVVTNRQVQVGQRLTAGASIMTLVPTDSVYVDANFKEDQFRSVKMGQPVELTTDFYGGKVVYHGRVTGYAGGTGASFALIPAQNATGNWIKVVQRLPVRITLDPNELHAHPLRVGLSVNATIDTRNR